jgi:co-chaperonin GroES (HSP10)
MSSSLVVVAEVDALTALEPRGFRLLVRIPPAPAKSRGGIDIPEVTRKLEEVASCMGVVLAMGKAAYKDQEKFPDGPWCQVGDTILMRQYSGTRFDIDGQEHRLINDDTVEGVVHDPARVQRK